METGWFFPEESESNSYFPQNITLVVTHDLDIGHPLEVISDQLPYQHTPTELEEK